jgi:hypothetical protein
MRVLGAYIVSGMDVKSPRNLGTINNAAAPYAAGKDA